MSQTLLRRAEGRAGEVRTDRRGRTTSTMGCVKCPALGPVVVERRTPQFAIDVGSVAIIF